MKILWSVDPFDENPKLRKLQAPWLAAIARQAEAEVEPIYILTGGELSLRSEISATWVAKYKPVAEKALSRAMKDLEFPGLVEPQVVVRSSGLLRDAVKAMATHSKREKASLIAVSTHARKGMDRFFLGSFTESLLHQSPVPVLTVSPDASKARPIRRILFATDLADGTERVFDQVVSFAADLGAEVTLFHGITAPLAPVVQSGVYLLGGGWIPAAAYLKQERKNLQCRADRILKRAAAKPIRTQLKVIDSDLSRVDSILEEAERGKYDLIAMAARTRPAGAAFLGSITRQVVRQAKVPVFVSRIT